MKNIKLKPLYLPSDDILIQPPNFLSHQELPKEKSSKIYLSNLEDLKNILRGRRLKSVNLHSKLPKNEELESVKKLNEFRPPVKLGFSPLSRKYTFRKSPSNINQETTPKHPTISKFEENPSFTIALQTILGLERQKTKEIEHEISKFSESNKDYEQISNSRMKQLTLDIEQVSLLILKCKVDIKEVKTERDKEFKDFEEKMNKIMAQETQHTLSNHTHVGKNIKPVEVTEERKYFFVKETLRKAKRDLHASHLESVERFGIRLESLQGLLLKYQVHKKNCQKEFKELKESLINFYCMNLKEGMDLREDGLRWLIKALWNMDQPVPVSAFPKYLDDESSLFLLNLAEKDLENIHLSKKLNELREEIKKDRLNSSFTKSPMELYGIVKERMREIKQKSKPLSLNSTFTSESRDTSEDYKYSRYDEIQRIKSKLKFNETTAAKMTVDEINRVFSLYNSENSKIGITVILRALVGNKYREFRRVAKMKTTKKD